MYEYDMNDGLDDDERKATLQRLCNEAIHEYGYKIVENRIRTFINGWYSQRAIVPYYDLVHELENIGWSLQAREKLEKYGYHGG